MGQKLNELIVRHRWMHAKLEKLVASQEYNVDEELFRLDRELKSNLDEIVTSQWDDVDDILLRASFVRELIVQRVDGDSFITRLIDVLIGDCKQIIGGQSGNGNDFEDGRSNGNGIN